MLARVSTATRYAVARWKRWICTRPRAPPASAACTASWGTVQPGNPAQAQLAPVARVKAPVRTRKRVSPAVAVTRAR